MTDSISSTGNNTSSILYGPDPCFDANAKPAATNDGKSIKQDVATAKAENVSSLYTPVLPKTASIDKKAPDASKGPQPAPKTQVEAKKPSAASMQEKNDGSIWTNGEKQPVAPKGDPPKGEPQKKDAPKLETPVMSAKNFFTDDPKTAETIKKAGALATAFDKCSVLPVPGGPAKEFAEALARGETVDQAAISTLKDLAKEAAVGLASEVAGHFFGTGGAIAVEGAKKVVECGIAVDEAIDALEK